MATYQEALAALPEFRAHMLSVVQEDATREATPFNVGGAFPAPPVTDERSRTPEGVIVSNYSPLSVTITAGTVGSSLTVRVFDAFLNGFDPTRSISRNWNIEENGNLTANLAFTYRNEDVNGNEAD